MAYSEKMVDMVRNYIAQTHDNVEEKKMFGGICFMVNDKMCVGVQMEQLMVRLDPALYETVMEKDGCRPMEFTGKPMKGYVYVDFEAINTTKKIAYWLDLALEFNKVAKSSKKKK